MLATIALYFTHQYLVKTEKYLKNHIRLINKKKRLV